MLQTTAQRFGSTGKSFVSPSAAAAVIGAALLASDTSDTSETAWSPAAACLLPDVLPVAGTLLSYGGSRQLAAGGTVTHSGALTIGANALTCGAITASGAVTASSGNITTNSGQFIANASGSNMILLNSAGTVYGSIGNDAGDKWSLGYKATTVTTLGTPVLTWTASGFVGINKVSPTVALDVVGAITASGTVTIDNGSSEGILNLTGTTGRTGYIKHNGTTVLQLTAYSSAVTSYKPIYVAHADGLRTAGPIQETPTQSALDPTTTNIPSGKRQGWYNSTLSEFRDWVNIGGTLLKSAAYT